MQTVGLLVFRRPAACPRDPSFAHIYLRITGYRGQAAVRSFFRKPWYVVSFARQEKLRDLAGCQAIQQALLFRQKQTCFQHRIRI